MRNIEVKTRYGTYLGKEHDSVSIFRGIRYAEPPTGGLRWKPPVGIRPSDEIHEAFEFGKVAIQEPAYSEQASYTAQGEDCLSLNIWTADINIKKPVMVFIHGGAFGWGGATDPLYDGFNFVNRRNDVVLVTIQYRLNNMGFLSLEEFAGNEYADSSNLGLLDQIEALRWIKENIDRFGGDPDNVTIFGESCGGCSVTLLMTMPKAKGLFHKVIAQSGCVNITQAEPNKQTLKKLLEVSEKSTMEGLLSMGEEELRFVNIKMEGRYDFPVRNDRLIPYDPYKAIQHGCAEGIKLMIGTNADEWNYWKLEIPDFDVNFPLRWDEMIDALRKDYGSDQIDQYFSLREDKSRIDKMLDFANDIAFRLPAILFAADQSMYADTYMYYFKEPSKIEGMGACHAVELAYIFQNLEGIGTIFTGPDPSRALASKVQDAWVNFAKTGNPSTETIPWPNYETKNRATMFIDNSKWEVVNDPSKTDRELLEKICRETIDLH